MMRIKKIDERKFEIEIDNKISILEDEKNFYLDKRTNEIYLQNLPENPYLKSISLKRIDKNGGEIIIDKIKKERENSSERISKKIEDYLSDEEKSEIERILNLGRTRMKEEEEKSKKMKENPRYKELLKMKKNLESLKELGLNIPEENFNKIEEELKKIEG